MEWPLTRPVINRSLIKDWAYKGRGLNRLLSTMTCKRALPRTNVKTLVNVMYTSSN